MDILSLISRGPEPQPSEPKGSIPLTSNHIVSLHPSWNVLDATKLKVASVCMRRFFFQYILGWDTDYKNHDFIFGEAGHLAKAHLINNGYSIESAEEAYNIFLSRYRKDFPEITDVDFHPKSPANMLEALISYCQEYRSDKFEVLYTEVADKIPVSEKYEIYFRMDAVLQHENSIWVRETKFSKWKTSNWGKSWLKNMQPNVYAHVLNCIAGDRYVRGVEMDGTFFYKNEVKHERAWVSPNAEEMEAWRLGVVSLIDDIYNNIEILKSESPSNIAMKAFRQNGEACYAYYNKPCPYNQLCDGCSNPLRILESENGEPPVGYIRKFWDPTKVEGFKPMMQLPVVEEPPRTQVVLLPVKQEASAPRTEYLFSCLSCGAPLFGRRTKCEDCMYKSI